MEHQNIIEETIPNVPTKKNEDQDSFKRNLVPIYSLNDMLLFCAKIYTELGYSSYHSNQLIADAHKSSYNTIKQKFSSAQQYGLLELKHRVGYKLTALFLKIYKPLNEDEKKEGIIEAIKSSDIYSKLIDECNGHPLPSEQGLAARLLRNYGIKDYAAARAAQIFISNIKDNGFIVDDVVVVSTSDNNSMQKKDEPNAVTTPQVETPVITVQPIVGYIEIPVPLNGGKRAYIKIPEDYKPEDCERIAKFVEALK